LTDFQLTLAQDVLSVAADADFALVGGGAVILLGVSDRSTADLDFFDATARLCVPRPSAFATGLSNARTVLTRCSTSRVSFGLTWQGAPTVA
jgi:hypothetical protein